MQQLPMKWSVKQGGRDMIRRLYWGLMEGCVPRQAARATSTLRGSGRALTWRGGARRAWGGPGGRPARGAACGARTACWSSWTWPAARPSASCS